MLLIRIVFDYKIDEVFLHFLRPRRLGRGDPEHIKVIKNSVETAREVVGGGRKEGKGGEGWAGGRWDTYSKITDFTQM